MKREALLKHLRKHGCYLKREGGSIRCGVIRRPDKLKPSLVIRKHQICWPGKFAVVYLFLKLENNPRH
jgi:hypothetical protein